MCLFNVYKLDEFRDIHLETVIIIETINLSITSSFLTPSWFFILFFAIRTLNIWSSILANLQVYNAVLLTIQQTAWCSRPLRLNNHLVSLKFCTGWLLPTSLFSPPFNPRQLLFYSLLLCFWVLWVSQVRDVMHFCPSVPGLFHLA